jgi:hypothetical protein
MRLALAISHTVGAVVGERCPARPGPGRTIGSTVGTTALQALASAG